MTPTPTALLRRALLPLVLLTLIAPAPGTSGRPAVAAAAATLDGGLTSALRRALDARRTAAGVDPLFSRTAYVTQAGAIARAYAEGRTVTRPPDGAPSAWLRVTTTEAGLAAEAQRLIEGTANTLGAVLRHDLYTDGGWAVAVRRVSPASVTVAVAGVVGWPAPVIGANSGCTTAGYCWSARGVNPHLRWTRNTLLVHLSSSGAPAAADSLVRAAIARLNKLSGMGADIRYGGRTTATAPGPGRRFLVRWSYSTPCGSAARGCTVTTTQGAYRHIVAAGITVSKRSYAANPRTEDWIGTLVHELGHALGLGHFSGTYAGRRQLMHPAKSAITTVQSGDANGLRRLARPGSLSVKLASAAPAFRSGSQARMTVSTSSSGLGGVRSVAIQCVDRFGVLRTAVRATGTWDIRGRSQAFSWRVGSGSAYATKCRAVATGKASRGYSAWVPVSFAG